MTIHIAVVKTRFGDNQLFTAKSEKGLYHELAEHCRDYWDTLDTESEAPENDNECVDTYFGLAALEGKDEDYEISFFDLDKVVD
jgi:hypothetical protein